MKIKSWVIVLGLTLSFFSGAYAGMGDHKGHGKMDTCQPPKLRHLS